MNAITIGGSNSHVLNRAMTELERLRSERVPLLLPSLSALFFVLLICGACFSEFYSAGIGFRTAFPTKSDGTSLAGDLMSLRFPIVFCLLAGDVLLHLVPSRLKGMLDGLVHGIGAAAILLLLFGVGAFMFSATFLTLGGDSGQGFAGRLVGLALGIASAAMFSISFLGSHAVMGRLLAVCPTIAAGRIERARIAEGDRLVGELMAHHTEAERLRTTISEMEMPDRLRLETANEAGVIVGMVASEFHDLVASRKVRGDRELQPGDHNDVPDVPLDALEQRYADLTKYTSDYFFDLLKQKEA